MLTKNKGSVFIVVTMVMSILMITISMLLMISATAIRTSVMYQDGVVAYNLALSGAEYGIQRVKANNLAGENIVVPQYSKASALSWSYVGNNGSDYVIMSNATYNKAKRSVRVTFTLVNGTIAVKNIEQI